MRFLGSGRARGVFAVAIVALASRAEATVTQVDGTIVPTGQVNPPSDTRLRMQDALDDYEGTGLIDAVKHASEFPQMFRPRLSSPVVFLDIRETAGFENSFGWYNVGDDVSTPTGRGLNLHPVMGCGVPKISGAGDATHHGDYAAYYLQTADEGGTISVNFAAEATAGRYRGGYIGFYLITPEGNPSSDNCGDFKNGSDGKSLFGFIYFTQKDLNNDGDFVHHLVYKSSKTADRFYFGFEDLFRGGDNDFEDMAMRIDGLTPPCVPSAEVCDGIDNDCDGVIDGADPDLVGTGTACACDDVAMTCDNGPRLGQCQAGVTACTAGEITCHGTGLPSPEVCDGTDNNCDGQVDNNPVDPTIITPTPCDGQDSDHCAEGLIVCLNGALVCDDNTGPNIEACNGRDDNCDGQTDEGDPGGGGSCGSSLGVCTPGTLHCVFGGLVCQGGNTGGPEICNGLDDNCNGVVDDNLVDTGLTCGASHEGECKLGQTICVGGSLQCAGEIGPSVERCNGLDDDCDGQIDNHPVDDGQPCGSSIGACEPGVLVCSGGGLVCTGGTGPTPELCNGIDDNCNGIVDDDVAGEGQACGGSSGLCAGAVTQCIAGAMECVGGTSSGTEVCNGIDDDCDGLIDEGDLCNGGVCDHGQCASPCVDGEFPCPNGKVCDTRGFCVNDPCALVSCAADADGNLQTCRDGGCVSLCSTIDCPADLVCRGRDGACVLDTCDYLPKCATDEICVDSACQPNPCNGVTCETGMFCRAGSCVASCNGVQCGATESCQDGACVATGCAVGCGKDICNPSTGACQTSRCGGLVCADTKVCEPLTGHCIADACQGVSCPTGQACSMGQCNTTSREHRVTTGGGGGCSTGGDGSLGALVMLALIGLVARRQPRRAPRRGWLVALLAVAPLALAGCRMNDYCLECERTSGDDGGVHDAAPDDSVPVQCDPNQIHPEVCNGVDDNCDGQIDEGFDLQTDPMNCGACGVACNKPGAQTRCVAAACEISGCFPGFNDKDGDTTGPYPASNGCEYQCFASNGGVEACDGLDNNCDGVVDEGIDKTSDPNNCGVCGRTCEFFGATGHCTASACRFDPGTDCQPGFFDIDGQQDNGCEYQCAPTNGGVEACDVRDNNCNGIVDEGFDLANDRTNCGRCGLSCQFPHATASCANRACKFDPAHDCQTGFVDVDGKQLNGCEYQCTKTNGGVESCDGIDNDCNGVADDNPADAGGACASTSPARGACVANGRLTCAAGHLVCTGATEAAQEACNNIDDNCDGTVDNGVTQTCYTGLPATTSGIGVCHPGIATCAAGSFGACTGQVTPSTEQCNGLDDDCNGAVDDAPGGGAITATCYTGAAGTLNVGTCKAGTKSCAFGAFGACTGEVTPTAHDVCGDPFDSDCDSKNDAAEGCEVLDAELRIDETTAGSQHSYDVVLARGGSSLGTNVYAAWSQLISGQTEVLFRKSSDGGKTWGATVTVTTGTGSKVKPALAVAPGATDRIVVVYQTVDTNGVRDIRVKVSTDGGGTFGAASSALDGAGDSFHHAVAISGNTCVVAWEKLDTSTLNRDIMSRTSGNGCTSFNAETKINVGSPSTRFAGRPQVGIASSGRIVWVWREPRTNSTRDIYAASAPNPTTAPTADTHVDGDGETTGLRDADFPVLLVNETNAYLVWQDVATAANGGSDVMFARSTDGGATWGTERIIDDPSNEVSSSFTPSLAVDPRAAGTADDVVAIAWEDRRTGTQIYASISSDGGATFAAPLRASSELGDLIAGATSVPQIAAAGGGVLAVVYQNQQTTGRPHAFIATSIDTGATWTYTEFRLDGGAGSALAPQVAASQVAGKPGAVAAWSDFRANEINGDIYVAVSH